MSTDYPTSLQDLDATRGTANQALNSPSHVTHHQTEDDTLEALQAKLGIDGSAVTTSIDYILKNTAAGHDHDGSDSKKVLVTNLDITGLSASKIVAVNSGATALEGITGPSGAIVGTTDTQTLSNKSLTSPILTTPQIEDISSDHQYIFAVSELAADRTVTLPLLTGADEFVFKDHAVTMTNKTHSGDFKLAGATDNIQVNSVDPWRTADLFGGLQPTTTAGCASKATIEAATNDIDYDVLDFDTSSDENAFINFQMPDSWDAGVIQFRYTWTNASGTSSQTVVFELSGISYADSDAIDQAVGTPIELSDTWLAQGDVHNSAWSGDVTIAGTPAAGEWVHFEIMRDVSSDNLSGDARLMGLQIRFKQAQYSD